VDNCLMEVGFLSVGRFERIEVLRADPELAGRLSGRRRARAEQLSMASVIHRHAGRWDAKRDADHARDGFGLVVLEGVLVRRVGVDDRYGAELLGPGDVLQPAQHDGEEVALPCEATWHVLSPLRLAVLNGRWVARMAPFPEVGAVVVARTLVRSRRLASMLTITHYRRLDQRLWLLFWEIADRFGRVRPEGIVIDIPMTHELIGHLVGARRPSVSAALLRLERDGRLLRSNGRWILRHGPPTRADVEDAWRGAEPASQTDVDTEVGAPPWPSSA
jgi:CRP/FNR family cyclic AMP-dependent transcriptional regulator